MFRTAVQNMHIEGGNSWAGNNKAKKSSGNCVESQTK